MDPYSYIASTDGLKTAEVLSQPFRILVVVPTLGLRLETLRRTLSSIRDQTEVSIDIVVVTKTNTPQLSATTSDFQAEIITNTGHISAAVNAGFATATSAHLYAAWLGDDDLLRPGALAYASSLLNGSPEATGVYGACDYIDVNGNLLFVRTPPPFAPVLLQFVPGLIKQEACLFRIKSLQKVGGLDEKLKYTMDLDILLRLRLLGPLIKSNRVHAAFCWHSGSLTISNRMASLVEAQNVQGKLANGFTRIIYPILKYPIRYLILFISHKISKSLDDRK